jgi:exopolyphosphatase/guanosine-5'-triphosphate,3'-diphosphate pyrophosphatase
LGGGSLQLALFRYRELVWANAFKAGTLRFITKTIKQNEIDALEAKVIELKSNYPDAEIMGSGGNINKISKIIGKQKVTYDDMKYLFERLNSVSYYDRIKKYGLREDRADVIIPALRLYMRILKLSGNNHILVPKTGLADGIIQSLFLRDYGINQLQLS